MLGVLNLLRLRLLSCFNFGVRTRVLGFFLHTFEAEKRNFSRRESLSQDSFYVYCVMDGDTFTHS